MFEKRQTRQGIDHIPNSRQHRVVDGEHSGEISRGCSSGSSAILRSMGMDDYHSRVHAIGYILSVPLGHMPVRDMEDLLQMQIEQRRPYPLLNHRLFVRNECSSLSSSLNYLTKIVTFNKKRNYGGEKGKRVRVRSRFSLINHLTERRREGERRGIEEEGRKGAILLGE